MGIRSDLDSVFKDETGHLSGTKIGTYAGQIIAGYLLLHHSDALIKAWDSLTVMFVVLIAPGMFSRYLSAKIGTTIGTTTIDQSSTSTTTTKG